MLPVLASGDPKCQHVYPILNLVQSELHACFCSFFSLDWWYSQPSLFFYILYLARNELSRLSQCLFLGKFLKSSRNMWLTSHRAKHLLPPSLICLFPISFTSSSFHLLCVLGMEPLYPWHGHGECFINVC